ncbi:hypothetical protein F4801DRAFT_578653 [Xylaria longipes]|nr:hypothetical protein F4801DRAFT_578653 [Xylaria longipes]
MRDPRMLQLADTVIDQIVKEYGLLHATKWLRLRMKTVDQQVNSGPGADKAVSADWFLYMAVFKLAEGLEVGGPYPGIECPVESIEAGTDDPINWEFIRDMHTANEECTNAQMVVTAVKHPNQAFTIEKKAIVISFDEPRFDDPWAWSISRTWNVDGQSYSSDFIDEVTRQVENNWEIKDLKSEAMAHNRHIAEIRARYEFAQAQNLALQKSKFRRPTVVYNPEITFKDERALEVQSIMCSFHRLPRKRHYDTPEFYDRVRTHLQDRLDSLLGNDYMHPSCVCLVTVRIALSLNLLPIYDPDRNMYAGREPKLVFKEYPKTDAQEEGELSSPGANVGGENA